MNGLLNVDSHFAFGENWRSYVDIVDERRIVRAEEGLLKLIPAEKLQGASFFDIGCGSGIHLLAAARLGAKTLTGVDLDPQSIEAARNLFGREAPKQEVDIKLKSVFDLDPNEDGQHDIVYSWGVLHHTGAMWRAIETAAKLVKPNGLFILALYQRTRMCPFWLFEKRYYAKASSRAQRRIRYVYDRIHALYQNVFGKGYRAYVENYDEGRGMEYWHDMHDWLGGYPYESVQTKEILQFAERANFATVKQFVFDGNGMPLGLFGSACAEYVLLRRQN